MAEYSLGTAKGRIIIDYDEKGLKIAADDFERTEKRARSAGQGFEEAGNKMALAGGLIAAGLGLAAKSAINFEKTISGVGAVSGATREELDLLRKKALQIGKDTAFGATEAAMAMEELAKSGISVTDILTGAADATVALAAAGAVELPAAAELAADAMNSFGLTAKDMPKIADLISGAANSSSISVNDFALSLKQVGAVAKLVGLNFEDTATAIALMGKVGIKGSDAGTSLKTMLSNLQPVTKKQIELFRELGIVTKDGSNRFFDAQGNMKSLAEVSQILQDATSGMTAQQRALALEMIFGSDAIRAAATLTTAGADGFNKMGEAMGKVTAQEVAAARLDNTAGAIEKLKGSAEGMAISFGTLVLPALTKVVQFLEKAADFFNGLSDSTKNAIINVALVTSGLLLFLGLAVKVYQFAKAVQFMVVAIKAWTLWTKLARAATIAWTAVQWLLNIALNANPIGLVVLAIAALIAGIILLWKNSETFRKIVLTVWEAIKKAALVVVEWFKNNVVPFFKRAWANIVSHFNTAKKVITSIIKFIADGIKFYVGIITNIINFLVPIFKSVFGLIASIVETAWTIISAIFSVFKTVVTAVFGPPLRALVAIFKWAWNNIVEGLQIAWNFIKTAWNAIIAFLAPIFAWIAERVRVTFEFWKNIITTVLNFLMPYIKRIVETIRSIIDKVWNGIKTTTSNVWNGIVEFVTAIWETMVGIFTSARDRVVAIIDGIKVIVDKIKNFFGELKAAADKGVGPLIDFVKGIPGRILDAIGNIGNLLYEKGRAIVQGLIDGLLSMINKLKSTADRVVSAIGDFLPGSPAKEGPLSGKGYVLKRGRRMVDDFATGINSAAKLARDAMAGMINGAASGLPVNGSAAVSAAQQGIAPVTFRVPTTAALANEANRSSSVVIESLNITGVWDLENPEVPREIVKKLHEQLDRYEREHA